MQPHNDNINNYSAEQILKYLRGEMLGPEMHAIEKAALEDPFLSEAIDGYRNALQEKTPEQILQDVKVEKQKISDKFLLQDNNNTKVRRLTWLKYAAAAAVILVSGYFIFRPPPVRDNERLAMTEKKQPAPTQDTMKANSTSPKEDATAPRKEEKPGDKRADINKNNEVPRAQESKQIVKKAQKKEINTPRILSDKVSGLAVENKEKSLQETASLYTTVNRPVEIHSFSGQVLSNEMKPLGRARINLPEKEHAFVTDESGNFSLLSKDTSLNVVVSAYGYEQKSYFLKPTLTANKIVLDTVPNGRLRKENIKPADTEILMEPPADSTASGIVFQNAAPVTGWVAFQEYINKNKKKLDSTYSGTVTISFIVWKDGRMTHFKIEHSLSAARDKEALNLIKNGPAWRVEKGMEARAYVSISF